MVRRREAIACVAVTLCAAGVAQGYDLLHPVPVAEMRELSADRPDVTESPKTVDAGHFQLELSFLEYARERDGAADVDAYSRHQPRQRDEQRLDRCEQEAACSRGYLRHRHISAVRRAEVSKRRSGRPS